MKKLRIYLDTSVINFLFADDAPERKAITAEFFADFVKPQVYAVWISPVVIRELRRTRDAAKRGQLLAVVADYGLALLPLEPEEEIVALAAAYVREGVIPQKKYDDALHIAVSTIQELDVLVSWNFEHLANVNKERRVSVVNQANGYFRPLRITTPLEVMSHE
ncbi:MAG: PIN domain-containing protein [Kiritimatiellaeota bacterium]|nr:PIN domain-containing protein [Kiritimatiellota bacterium]